MFCFDYSKSISLNVGSVVELRMLQCNLKDGTLRLAKVASQIASRPMFDTRFCSMISYEQNNIFDQVLNVGTLQLV